MSAETYLCVHVVFRHVLGLNADKSRSKRDELCFNTIRSCHSIDAKETRSKAAAIAKFSMGRLLDKRSVAETFGSNLAITASIEHFIF